jgi:hypothetical protein
MRAEGLGEIVAEMSWKKCMVQQRKPSAGAEQRRQWQAIAVKGVEDMRNSRKEVSGAVFPGLSAWGEQRKA